MNTALLLAIALGLDALCGEPRWLWSRVPHPAVLMGRAIKALDQWLNHGNARRIKGILAICVIAITAAGIGWLVSLLGPVAIVVLAAVLLAQKSLDEHATDVATGLRVGLPMGRAAVAMIVSRDTAHMSESQVARSTIESAAENLSDAVVAPAFWFLIAGLPGLVAYKAVNTADSMIGYRTDRYLAFGWAAARLDDLLNWIPARLTAGLIIVRRGAWRHWSNVAADARQHKSPNAGWPESAAARVLGVALAGPRSYDGTMQNLAWVNGSGLRDVGPSDIDATVDLLWQVWTSLFAICTCLGVLFLVLGL